MPQKGKLDVVEIIYMQSSLSFIPSLNNNLYERLHCYVRNDCDCCSYQNQTWNWHFHSKKYNYFQQITREATRHRTWICSFYTRNAIRMQIRSWMRLSYSVASKSALVNQNLDFSTQRFALHGCNELPSSVKHRYVLVLSNKWPSSVLKYLYK